MISYRGYSVAITGASSGIGLALANNFLNGGAHVFAIDLNDSEFGKLSKTARLHDCNFVGHQASICDFDRMEELIKAFEAFSVDELATKKIWINAAGVQKIGRYDEIGRKAFFDIIDINFKAQVDLSELAIALFKKLGGGYLVNIASLAGFLSSPYMSAYVASKHALVGYTRSLQLELEHEKWPIHTTLACPGFVKTPMIASPKLKHSFPEWLSWVLSDPDHVAKEIITATLKQKKECYPGTNGKLLKFSSTLMPSFTSKNSTILLADSFMSALIGRDAR